MKQSMLVLCVFDALKRTGPQKFTTLHVLYVFDSQKRTTSRLYVNLATPVTLCSVFVCP